MSDLTITRLLPNPVGKDKPRYGDPPPEQLNGEWVEWKNTSNRDLSLDDVSLLHTTFDGRCTETGEQHVGGFTGMLDMGHSLRVHTGPGTTHGDPSDPKLTHVYLGRKNYIWNNVCGDTAILRVPKGRVDHASYDRNPPEGVALVRVPGTNRLAVPMAAASGWR